MHSRDPAELPIAYIRTSDRLAFKRCRRKWSFHSGLRRNLDTTERPVYFWIGSGCHFALEDYHGYNYYGSPVTAFQAYVDAWRQLSRHNSTIKIPVGWEEEAAVGEGILTHYLQWLTHREAYDTFMIDDVPQVELRLSVEVPLDPEFVHACGYQKVIYNGTIDRMVVIDGALWVQDYKFYKSINEAPHLDWDPQMGAYIWLANAAFPELRIEGAMYSQFRKEVPNQPRILANGRLSTGSNQKTTHYLYRQMIEKMYGNVNAAPPDILDFLNTMAMSESPDRDDFIRRDRTRRNEQQQAAEGEKILMEVAEMISPDLPLYPNPTRDCSWDCSLADVCIAMDRGDDWENLLNDLTFDRQEVDPDIWREYLPE